MANESRGNLFMRPRFLLFCLFVMAYITVRSGGELVYQPARNPDGGTHYIIGANIGIPRWRRQLYRALFSPFMVVEEEGRRLASDGLGLALAAGDYGHELLS